MDNYCKICKKQYKSYQSLWNHNKKFHSNVKTKNDFNTILIKPKTSLENFIVCKYCNKSFTRRNNLNQHIKNICKEKDKIIQEEKFYKEQIERLSNEVEKLKKQSYAKKIINYNGPINNIVNNTLNICKPGEENINLLSVDEKKYIMSQGLNSIVSLVDRLNFNEDLPQHHNFYVSAINDKHVNAIDDNTKRIIKKSKKDLFDKILFSHITKMEKINKNINYKDFNSTFEKLKAFIFLKKGKKEFFNQINMLSYNKKNMIIKTWEKLIDDNTINPEDVSDKFENEINIIAQQPEIDTNDTDSDSDDERPQLVFPNKNIPNNEIEL
jgi:hypothetical protein